MTRTKFTVASLIVGLVAVAVVAVAQEQSDTGKDMLTGKVLVLRGDPAGRNEVNKGGLVVAEIPDSASRPPRDPDAEHSRAFQRLGKVQGVRTEGGRQLAGGGYTWILLKALNEGPSKITVTYTPNTGGDPVKTTYDVTVTAE